MNEASLLDRLHGKRIALAMSAGFFGFFHQAGVLKALLDAGIHPVRISGNSAGALVAGLFASGLEPKEIRDLLLSLKRSDFWDMEWPLGARGIGILGGYRFKKQLETAMPVSTFEACRLPLTVGAYDLEVGRVKHLCSGPLVPAVYASCAVPYLFKPEVIDGRRLWDGGFAEKTPLGPFVGLEEIDTVLISYLPPRGREAGHRKGIRKFLPRPGSLFADIPTDERKERDLNAIELLQKEGKDVIALTPPRLAVGPFSLQRARASYEQGETGTQAFLASDKIGTTLPGW